MPMLQLNSTNPLVGGAVKPTTDALKHATDRLLKEQQSALHVAAQYRQKLEASNNYVARLEQAYKAVVKNNSGLRAKVASDDTLVQDLCSQFDAQGQVLASLEKRLTELAGELFAAESHREQLVKGRSDAEDASKKLSEDLAKSNEGIQAIRAELSEAVCKCNTLEEELKTCREELDAQKSTADQQIALLSSSLEETKVELSAATSTFAQQEESLRLQLSAATSNAADVSTKYEEKLVMLQKLENELCSVEAVSKDLEEKSALVATLKSTLEETSKQATDAVAKVAELEAQLTSEKQRYEQLSQQADADRLAAALALEEARKKFDLDLEEALKTAQLESEKELGVERERMSTEIARMQAEHTAKLDSLTADLAASTKQTAADEKEKARLENLLDERNLLISQLEQKCSERAAEITSLQQDLNVAAHEAMSTAEKAAKLQQEIEEINEELEEKRVALESISAFAGKQNNIPTAPVSAIKKRRAASKSPPARRAPRLKQKARFNDNPISRTLILEEEENLQEQPYASEPQDDDAWGFDGGDAFNNDEEDEDVDEEALRTAIVIHTTNNSQDAPGASGGRPVRQARMRQSQVIVEEVDDSDEESYEVPPRALHRNKAPAVKPIKPCLKPSANGGGSRPASKSRLAAMRPANSFKPSSAIRRGGVGKVVANKSRGVSSQQHTGQNHTLFNLFGGLGNASPGDS